ncbi:MAG: leucine-rich repeat domain-containing protein [Alistipes sp.]|nr:leucine-rich repeat domain-containing protein [Alistipes sp.]
MKRLFILFASFPMLLCGCSSFDEQNDTPIQPSMKEVQAGFAKETRTYVENERLLRWHEDDRLTVFYGNTLNDQYKFKGKTGDNSGTFSLVPSGELGTGNTLPNIYGIYPYNEDARITDDGIITYSLPAIQSYAGDSFGKGANTMIAVTENLDDTFLSFRNLCGYLKLKLYGNATIKSIEVKGNFAEKIAGEATITATYGEAPTLEMNTNATQTITLDCGEGVTLGTSAENATTFWIVIPETTFKYGITITATSTDNKVFTKSTSNSVIIERNTPTPMGALEFVGEDTEITPIAPSTIIYTTDDGNIVDLYTTEGFGSEYVSNVYDKKSNIGTITFAGDINTIPAEAFLVCTNLTSVQIPNTVKTIAERAFYGCNYMEKIVIPESVTTITETAFDGCSGEAHIFCNINDKAFVGALFTKVVLDDCVTTLGQECFMDCTELKEVVLSKGLTSIPYYAFQNTAIENITVPEGVVSLEEGVFFECSKLKSAILPESIDVIGGGVFSRCSMLQEVKMPTQMKSIGGEAFWGCSSLLEFVMPEGVTSIEQKTFHNCSSLTSLTLPSSITAISGAFYGCYKLTRLNIPNVGMWLNIVPKDAVGFLGGEVPFADSGQGDIYVGGELLTDLVIPNNILTIYGSTFRNCTSIKSLTIGSRVTKIGDAAFDGCRNLSNIVFSKSTTTYGIRAFAGTGITEITITKQIANNNSGNEIFADCKELTQVTIEDGVTIIPYGMFSASSSINSNKLTSITIPDSVTSIGSFAFNNCIVLQNIYWHDSIRSLGNGVFRGCESLTEITIPKETAEINNSVFEGCTSLKQVNMHNDITSIGHHAFMDCHALENLTLPKNLTTIGSEAFWYCHSLKHIDIPEGVKTIGYQVFLDSGLEEVLLPETLESIGYRAFCCPIKSIIIPKSVTNIDAAFFMAYKLETTYFCSTKPPYMASMIFDYAGSHTEAGHTTIYVPNEAVDAYKAALPQYVDQIVGYNPSEQTNH